MENQLDLKKEYAQQQSGELTAGDVEELKNAASRDVNLTLIKKDFSNKVIDGIKLSDSIIAKNLFNDANIYNCEFTRCEFTKDNFTGATLSIITFKDCLFYAVDFSNCVFKTINFDGDCKFTKCKFDGVDMTDNVIGISAGDLKVISEQSNDEIFKLFEACGFKKEEKEDPNEDISFINAYADDRFAVIYHDPDKNDNTWNMSFFYKNECYFTADFVLDKYVLSEQFLAETFKYGQKILERKIKETE